MISESRAHLKYPTYSDGSWEYSVTVDRGVLDDEIITIYTDSNNMIIPAAIFEHLFEDIRDLRRAHQYSEENQPKPEDSPQSTDQG